MAMGVKYEPLDTSSDEIRLLRLHCHRDQDAESVLECDLFHASLNNGSVKYDAISYVWGNSGNEKSIRINGQDAMIGCSLCDALLHLRTEETDRVLWADAVCINQSDIAEKNHQVTLMGLIYCKADRVRAWLGSSTDGGDIAFTFLMECANFQKTDEGWEHMNVGGQLIDYVTTRFPTISEPRTKAALQDFMERPYWTRTWIFQELALAKQVIAHCGILHLGVRDIRSSMSFLLMMEIAACKVANSNIKDIGQLNFGVACSSMCNMLQKLPHSGSVYHRMSKLATAFVQSLAHCGATDPRDKIYGLLGFIDPQSNDYDLISASYSLSVEQVYTQYAQYAIKHGEGYQILRISGRNMNRRGETDSLPTWVPDWRDSLSGSGYSLPSAEFHERDSALPGEDATDPIEPASVDDTESQIWLEKIDTGRLAIRGWEVEKIDEAWWYGVFPFWQLSDEVETVKFQTFWSEMVGGAIHDRPGETDLMRYFRLIEVFYNPDAKMPPDGICSLAAMFLRYVALKSEVLLKRLESDNNFERFSIVSRDTLEQIGAKSQVLLVEAFLGANAAVEDKGRLQSLMNDVDMAKEAEFAAYMALCLPGNYPFRTESGKLGLGSHRAKKSDRIFYLAPNTLPFIFSPTSEEEGRVFSNVGQCFVPDLEPLQHDLEQRRGLRDIELR